MHGAHGRALRDQLPTDVHEREDADEVAMTVEDPQLAELGATIDPDIASGRARGSIASRFDFASMQVRLELVSEREPVFVDLDRRYGIQEKLGGGAMGTVYRAIDTKLAREIAIKVVNTRDLDKAHLDSRLLREARALAALQHQNVLAVYDVDTADSGEPFIAMAYEPGSTLREWQAVEGRKLDELLSVYVSAARGLAAAHDKQIVHRDFKPDNVLVDHSHGRLRAVVVDFGLAGGPHLRSSGEPERERTSEEQTVQTETGAVIGTYAYMSPEQHRREPAQYASDQYAFCVSLWEALAGRRPFEDPRHDNLGELPERPREIPKWLDRILRRGLAVDSSARWPAMHSLVEEIERQRRLRLFAPWITLVAAVLVLGLALPWVLLSNPRDACANAGDPIESVWNANTRVEVERALQELELSYSDSVAAYTLSRLDAAVDRWQTAARTSCERRRDQGPSATSDREDACLERWHRRFSQRVTQLKSAPDERIASNVLGFLEPMLDVDDHCAVPPPMLDGAVQTALEQAEDAELLIDHQAGLAAAERAVGLAQSLEHPCRENTEFSAELASAQFRLAHVHDQRGDPQAALVALAIAKLNAIACDEPGLQADARLLNAAVLAVDFQRTREALAELREGEALLVSTSEPAQTLRQHERWKMSGLIALTRGEFATAQDAYQKSLDALGDPRRYPARAAKVLGNIGAAYQEAGQYENADRAYRQASALVEELLEFDHPAARAQNALVELNLGLAAFARGELDAAERHLGEVVAHGQPALVAKAWAGWIQSALEANQHQQAAELSSRALTLLRAHAYLPPRTRAELLTAAGQARTYADDEDATVLLEEALPLWEELGEPSSRDYCRFMLAEAHAHGGTPQEAHRQLQLVRASETYATDEDLREVADALALALEQENQADHERDGGPSD
jgi:serine/threonine protein kinase